MEAQQQFAQMVAPVYDRIGQTFGAYQYSLQARYGDPRIYQQQQREMVKDQVMAAHAKDRETSKLLEDAYSRQTERNRATHYARVNSKTGQTTAQPPGSVAVKKPRKPRQPAAP